MQNRAFIRLVRTAFFATAIAALPQAPSAQEAALTFDWQIGPHVGELGEEAKVDVPEGMMFLGHADTVRLLQAMENPTSGYELGTITPVDENESWFVFFEFDETGYISAEESDELDAVKLLDTIREGNEMANRKRTDNGWAPMSIDGWQAPPLYNESTQNLEWAISGNSEGLPIINHDIRMLGRYGVMQVSLVADPDDYERVLPAVQNMLHSFRFKVGHGHSEYVAGDRVAEYGLAALITGGIAVKTGLLRRFSRLIAVLCVSAGVLMKKYFSRAA